MLRAELEVEQELELRRPRAVDVRNNPTETAFECIALGTRGDLAEEVAAEYLIAVEPRQPRFV